MTRTASGVRRHLCQDCWPLKPGAVSSQRLRRSQSQGARGGPNSGNFLELVSKVLGCAYASYFTDNKAC